MSLIKSINNQLIHCKYQMLMTVSLALLLSYPFMVATHFGELLLDTLTNLVFLAALIAVSRHKAVLRLAILLLCPALAFTWLPLIKEPALQYLVEMSFTAVYVTYVTWQIFIEVFNQRIIRRDTLVGAICVYLLLGLLWSYFYLLLLSATPDALSLNPSVFANNGELSANLLYFSYTTLTTVGYGDITPVSLMARSIATIEQIIGVFYIAILVSRLVSMHQKTEELSK